MTVRRLLAALVLTAAVHAGKAQSQAPSAAVATDGIVIVGLGGGERTVASSDLARMPRRDTGVRAHHIYLIIPGERRPAPWVRQVAPIQLRRAE